MTAGDDTDCFHFGADFRLLVCPRGEIWRLLCDGASFKGYLDLDETPRVCEDSYVHVLRLAAQEANKSNAKHDSSGYWWDSREDARKVARAVREAWDLPSFEVEDVRLSIVSSTGKYRMKWSDSPWFVGAAPHLWEMPEPARGDTSYRRWLASCVAHKRGSNRNDAGFYWATFTEAKCALEAIKSEFSSSAKSGDTATETENNMTARESVVDTLSANVGDAAMRTAARTMLRTLRGPLAEGLASRDTDNAQALAAFFRTRNGEAVLALLAGCIPLFVEGKTWDPRVHKLAEELRIQGAQIVFDDIADALVEPIVSALTKAVAQLPAPKDE